MEFGSKTVSVLTSVADAVTYKTAAHNVSNVDTIAVRRTLPVKTVKGGVATVSPLRSNVRFEKSFSIGGDATAPVTVNISAVVPVGVDPVTVDAYIDECLANSAVDFPAVALTGDIHLE